MNGEYALQYTWQMLCQVDRVRALGYLYIETR